MRRRTFCASALGGVAAAALPLRLLANDASALTSPIESVSRIGKQLLLTPSMVTELRDALRGPLLIRSSVGYDSARRIWNGAFDKHPALIARCAGAADVIQCVQFARAHDLLVAVRGGGHSLPGHSTCDGGLMIDLSQMRSVRVDRAAGTVHVEPGVLLGELDRETQAFGLAVPAGTVSHTGVAGLTLGGGAGRLSRKYGLTCDNVLAVDIVTASGELLRASAEENPDLFWGVRGGGGNFGVVTAFQFRSHRVGPMMTGGDIIYRIEDARDVLRYFADYAPQAPEEVWIDPMIDRLEDGTTRLVVAVSHCGSPSDAERELRQLRTLRRPLHDGVAAQTYVKVQSSQDDMSPHGRGYYMTSGLVSRMEHDLIDASLEAARHPHARLSKISFTHHGGAIARLPSDHSAYPGRAGLHSVVVRASWDDPTQAQNRMQWGRETAKTLAPFMQGYYANLSQETGRQRVRNNYGANLERLVALKTKYDPLNLFRLNPNIEPRAASG
jgi:FAD/FMN-containing dehydrogenase